MQAPRMKPPYGHSPLCSLADRQGGTAFLPQSQLFDTTMRLRHRSRCQIASLRHCQNVDHPILSSLYRSDTCEDNTILRRLCCKDVARKRLGTFLLSQSPIVWMLTRARNCVDQVVIVYQRALARHQLVCEDRGYCVFACTGKAFTQTRGAGRA
jgi:hypothetical protein